MQSALGALNLIHQKHEMAVKNNEVQLNALLENSHDLMVKNADLVQLSMNQLHARAVKEERQRNMSHQPGTIPQLQWIRQQLGVREQVAHQVQQDMAQMRGGGAEIAQVHLLSRLHAQHL